MTKLDLYKTVIIGYADIGAASCRALLGVDCDAELSSLDIPELPTLRPACVATESTRSNADSFKPVQIHQCKTKQCSIVIINSVIPDAYCHLVSAAVLDACKESQVERLYSLTSVHLDISNTAGSDLYESTFNAKPVTTSPSLPSETRISDALLSTFIQMIQIDQISCSILLTPGYRANESVANKDDGSLQNILRLQQTLSDICGLKFDKHTTMSMMYKGKNEDDVDMASMIYV